MLPARLDYLFVADFKDGSRYFQTPNDRSIVHPLTRSAFWDVLQRQDDLLVFHLVEQHHQHQHSVWLDDGHFKSDGTILTPPAEPGPLHNFRLVYLRRCQQVFEAGKLSYPRIVAYLLGWQANDAKGKSYKMVLQIDPPGSLNKPRITDGSPGL